MLLFSEYLQFEFQRCKCLCVCTIISVKTPLKNVNLVLRQRVVNWIPGGFKDFSEGFTTTHVLK